jgi:hypothetical protein
MSSVDNELRPPQQQHSPQVPIVQNHHETSFNNVVEDSSIDISSVVDELNKPKELDTSEIKRFTMRELSAPTLTTIEEPDNFYQSIKAFMDEKIDKGDNSLTTTKLMNQLNQFIDSRMNKILMTCFRHYNNERILEEQKSMMTPQELEMASKVIQTIKDFREFIYH